MIINIPQDADRLAIFLFELKGQALFKSTRASQMSEVPCIFFTMREGIEEVFSHQA